MQPTGKSYHHAPSPMHALGYQYSSVDGSKLSKTEKKNEIKRKAAGYTPIVGTIYGLSVLFITVKNEVVHSKKPVTPFVAAKIARAAFNATSLGILLLIPDLVITIGRKISDKLRSGF